MSATQLAPTGELDWRNGRITDDGLAAMKAKIGYKYRLPAWNHKVTEDGIWHFALGIGDDNPLWWDQAYAAKNAAAGIIAPPCYLYSHSSGPRLRPEHGRMSVETFLPGVLGLWAGEHWTWLRPARVGETIHADNELIEAELVLGGSFGGKSVRQTERATYITEEGETIAWVDHTIMRFERGETRARNSYLDRERAVWNAEDRKRFTEQYLKEETTSRRGDRPRYLQDVVIGEPVGPILKGPLTVTNIVGFLLGFGCPLAPANRIHHAQLRDHPGAAMVHPVTGIEDNIEAPHWDRDLARASGMPDGYDFGAQRVSWMSHLLTDWAGDAGFITSLSARIRRPNILGDITWVSGKVTSIDLAKSEVSIAITAINQMDETTATAMATVRLPSRA